MSLRNNGVVIDKEVKDVTPLFGVLFGSPKVKHKLMVKFSGENEKTVYRTFFVHESTYLAYDIGDCFNPRDLSSSDEQ